MKISISARVAVYRDGTRDLLEGESLRPFDGISYTEDGCATYLEDALADIGLAEGFLRLQLDQSGHLRIVTDFQSPRKLKPGELKKLAKEVEGQWSDGMGEGCFDDVARKHKVEIDLVPMRVDRDVRIEQVEDGKPDDAAVKATRKLLTAVNKGDVKKAQEALAAGADVNANRQGFTVLDRAVGRFTRGDGEVPVGERGQSELRQCGWAGARYPPVHWTGRSPTKKARRWPAILLAHGADVNFVGIGDTPLYYAP